LTRRACSYDWTSRTSTNNWPSGAPTHDGTGGAPAHDGTGRTSTDDRTGCRRRADNDGLTSGRRWRNDVSHCGHRRRGAGDYGQRRDRTSGTGSGCSTGDRLRTGGGGLRLRTGTFAEADVLAVGLRSDGGVFRDFVALAKTVRVRAALAVLEEPTKDKL